MSTPAHVPELRILNLMYLLKIQVDANKDPAQACYRYGLPRDRVLQLKDIPFDSIAALVANLDQSCFALRTELFDLFNAPALLASTLASVRMDNRHDASAGSNSPAS